MPFRITRFRTTDSTSERAFAALAAGTAADGDVFVAEEQTAGRGRLGRRWHSAPGAGLYASVVLLPREPASPAGLTIAVGLATLDAVRAVGLRRARSKWPNDVVVPGESDAQDAKLAGVLIETRGLDPRRPHYVAGVGVNVGQREFPAALRAERAVTSLALSGIETTTDALLDLFLGALPARVDSIRADPSALTREFLDAIGMRGARVAVTTGEEVIVGTLARLDLTRGFALDRGDGTVRHVALEIARAVARA